VRPFPSENTGCAKSGAGNVRMIPSNYDTFPNASDGEQFLYDAFRKSTKGTNWTIFHSLELGRHINQSEGECDFLILAPGLGALVLEVKAARTVARDESGWKLGTKHSKKGPFKQARDAMHSIRDYLAKENIDLYDIPFVSAVWFTHLPKSSIPKSIEWTDDELLGVEDTKLDIFNVISSTIASRVQNLGIHFGASRASVKSLQTLEKALSPMFVAQQAPVQRQREISDFAGKALEEQLERVSLILSLPRIMLEGLAGTGKTHIAIHAARLAQEAGKSTLFLCYNSLLAKDIREKLEDSPLVRVTSLHALFLEIAETSVPAKADHHWWSKELPNLAMKNIDAAQERFRFERVIIDEAQDIGTEEYLLVLDALLQGGLASKEVLVCGDFENQGLFLVGEDARLHFTIAIPDLQTPKPLQVNCRNTREVGLFVQTLLELDPGYLSYRNDAADGAVKPANVKHDGEIPSKLKQEAETLLKRYTPDQIVVVSSSASRLQEVMDNLTLATSPLKNPRPKTIRWGSVAEFKGLEAMAIIHVEFLSETHSSLEAFYVGATRSLNDYVWVGSQDIMRRISGHGNEVGK
jgi:hypothetical protein